LSELNEVQGVRRGTVGHLRLLRRGRTAPPSCCVPTAPTLC